MRFLLSTLTLLLLASIVWVTLASLPQMTTVPWIPSVGRWQSSIGYRLSVRASINP